MASAKSDEHTDESHHPLAENRPGVYVQVVSPRRRRERRDPLTAGSHPSSGTVEVPITVPGETVHVQQVRESGVGPRTEPAPRAEPASRARGPGEEEHSVTRPIERSIAPTGPEQGQRSTPSQRPSDYASAQRQDLISVHLPGPPRMPNMTLSGSPLPMSERPPRVQAASVLDAPRSIRPDSIPAKRGPSWMLLAGVAALSGIIAAAAVVAVRGSGPVISPAPIVDNPTAPPPPERLQQPSLAEPLAWPGPQPAAPASASAQPTPVQRPVTQPVPSTKALEAKPVDLHLAARPADKLQAAPAAPARSASAPTPPAAAPAKAAVKSTPVAPAQPAVPPTEAAAEPTEGAAPASAPPAAQGASRELPENPYAQ